MAEIVESDGVLGGKPRVSAEQIYEMHTEKGVNPEEIVEILPTVDLEGVNAAVKCMK